MKKFIHIFSILLLTVLAGCSEDLLMTQQPENGKDDYVTLRFTLEDIPDFKEITTKAVTASETGVASLSLMTFDASGNFLGRTDASSISISGLSAGTATASVPVQTKTIHFIANYAWSGDEYRIPRNGQTETTVMPALITSSPFVAWGRVSGITDFQQVSVRLVRNYAKVLVESKDAGFQVGGFALAHYAPVGTVAPWNEDDHSSFSDLEGRITTPATDHLTNQSTGDCNQDVKYMFEYQNLYTNQTSVIIKKSGVNQYYKIQLIDKSGQPYKIERNYIYKITITRFSTDATGSPSFDEALKAAPSNNIYAEITREAPSISDSDGNKLKVSPLFHLFTEEGTLSFDANYWLKGTLSNGEIKISKIQNGNGREILSDLPLTIGSDGQVTAHVSVPQNISGLDSATVLVKAGVLSRTVTVYVSKRYSFAPATGAKYSNVGQEVALAFTIPSDYPSNLFPVKCYIKAEDLNPVKEGQEPMLIEQRNNTYYYVYLATKAGLQTVKFKTIRSTVTNPTVENDYFSREELVMQKGNLNSFSAISTGSPYYENGSTFDLIFTASTATSVTITGDGISKKTVAANKGTNRVTLTTTKDDAQGTIKLEASNYSEATVDYSNNSILKAAKTVTGALNMGYISYGSYQDEYVTSIISISADNSNVSVTYSSKGYSYSYTMTLKAGTSVAGSVALTVKTKNYYTYLSNPVRILTLLQGNNTMQCLR